MRDGARLADLLRRPRMTYDELAPFDPERPALSPGDGPGRWRSPVKYAGLYRPAAAAGGGDAEAGGPAPARRTWTISPFGGLRLEARQKLDQIRPQNLGQASRVSGVSPADVAVLMVYLEQVRTKEKRDEADTSEGQHLGAGGQRARSPCTCWTTGGVFSWTAGWPEEREEIEKTLLEAGLEPAGILCSHAHVDHCANNRYFQEKYHLPVALTAPEAGMCSSILNLKCYRLLVSPDAAEQEMSEMVHVPDLILPPVDGPIRLAGAMFRILHTPGHSSGHICAVTPDNVCYTGDALMSQALLDAKLPYGLSIQLAMESRERLQELEDCDFFIMAHKGVCHRKRDRPPHRRQPGAGAPPGREIRDLITEPMDFSQICRAVCTRFSTAHPAAPPGAVLRAEHPPVCGVSDGPGGAGHGDPRGDGLLPAIKENMRTV